MIQEKDLGRGIPKSPTAVVPEPVVEEAKPLTKLEQYKLRLEEKEKEKAAKAEAKRKAKKEHNKQTVKEQNDLYTGYSSDQNTSSKNDLTKTIQVVKR